MSEKYLDLTGLGHFLEKLDTRYARSSDIPSVYIKSASVSGNTLTLTKQDDSTQTFTPSDNNYYPTAVSWTNGGASGPTGTITMSGTSNISIPAIPGASASASGVVTTGGQTFAGNKGFNGSVVLNNGGTFYKPIYLGTGISSYGDGSTVYLGEDLIMNRRTGAVSGFYAESSQWNRFLGLYMNPTYICTCNYKGDGTATAATSSDGLWKASQSGDNTYWSGYLGYLFNSNFTTGATFPVANLSTNPVVITIKTADGSRIDATDTDYVELNGWRYEGYQSSSDHYGTLTSYKLELLLQRADDSSLEWVTTFERTGVTDVIKSLKFPVWSQSKVGSAHSNYNPTSYSTYKYFYGIRLTISGANVGGISGCFGLTELKLMETRPAGAPADGVGAISQLGGNLYGNITLPSKSGASRYTEIKISPADSDNYNQLGESSKQWYRIYGKNIYRNGTEISSLYAPISHASSNTTYGLGTASNYGHVKIQSGDMNGTSSTNGIAAGLGHTHSNYLTSSDLSNYVDKTTNQEIGGVKTFTSRPQLSITPRLPSEYQEVDYIQSSGSQYIDTGVNLASDNFEIEATFTEVATSNYEQHIFSIWTSTYGYWTAFINSQNKIDFYAQGHNTTTNTVSTSSKNILSVKRNGTTWDVTLNDVLKTVSYTPSTTNPTTVKLFIQGDGGEPHTNIKMYDCIIKKAGTLVRNFIPCYRKSDNEIGLYDLVNNNFYTNAGSGTFTKGANIESSPFLVESDLSTVAISGDYNDLDNKPSTSNFVTLDGTQTITGQKDFSNGLTLTQGDFQLGTGGWNELVYGSGKILVDDINDFLLINVDDTTGDLEFPRGATASYISLSYQSDSSSDGSDGMLENIEDELFFNGSHVSGKIHTASLSGGSRSILPNNYYILTGTSFTFTLLSGKVGILNEYMGEITTTAGTTLNFTGITWIASGDNITVSGSNLTLASGHTYQFSIVNNCGLIVEF